MSFVRKTLLNSAKGAVGASIRSQASASGVKLGKEFTKTCILQGITVDCGFNQDYERNETAITIHNPNIETQKGFFLQVARGKLGVKV